MSILTYSVRIIKVIDAWGYTFKIVAFVWVKTKQVSKRFLF